MKIEFFDSDICPNSKTRPLCNGKVKAIILPLANEIPSGIYREIILSTPSIYESKGIEDSLKHLKKLSFIEDQSKDSIKLTSRGLWFLHALLAPFIPCSMKQDEFFLTSSIDELLQLTSPPQKLPLKIVEGGLTLFNGYFDELIFKRLNNLLFINTTRLLSIEATNLKFELNPYQIAIVTVSNQQEFEVKKVYNFLCKKYRVLLLDNSSTVSKKIVQLKKLKIPYYFVYGEKEAKGAKIKLFSWGNDKEVLIELVNIELSPISIRTDL